MKHLALVRHAKADWPNGVERDFDRPLSVQGKQDAKAVGQVLARRGPTPGMILASPARRTKQTAIQLAEAYGLATEDIRYTDAIYEASTGELLDLLRALPDAYDRVMVVAHNPGVERLAALLTDGETGVFSAGRATWVALATETWQNLTSVQATLVDDITP